MRPPEVSVVVPAFNAARHLPATLDAILAQRGVALEVLVVDDRSSDATPQVVADLAARDARVRYLCTPANTGGPAGPRNLGVRAAAAEWVALCDADDLWHPDKLRLQLECARATGADLVCTGIRDFADGTTPALLASMPPAAPRTHPLRYWQMLLKDRIATSSVLCRSALLATGGGFDTARELVAVEDYDLWLRAMEAPVSARVVRIDTPLVAYRRLAGSLSSSKWRHARKVMRVTARAFDRAGWRWAYPLALPWLFAAYGVQAVWWRVVKGSL
jgi:glycosyltransferase involved in cell wall biosynthesis